MFVYNSNFNKRIIIKILFILISIIISIYFIYSAYRIYNSSFKIKNDNKSTNTINITNDNYTNILKSVHDDINSYIGKNIHFTGYIYKQIDFKDNQFVLARDMLIDSENQTVIVGFLCECDKTKKFETNNWVEITGKISKGNYHGEIPIIKIKEIKKIDKPTENIYVYPPDNTYVPTTNIY